MVDISRKALKDAIRDWNPLNQKIEDSSYEKEVDTIIESTKPLAILTPTILALRIQSAFEYYFGEKGKRSLSEITEKVASKLFSGKTFLIKNSKDVQERKIFWFDLESNPERKDDENEKPISSVSRSGNEQQETRL